MSFTVAFIVKLLPLYMNILIGYIAGRKLQANQEIFSKLMFYIIAPLIIFNGVIHTEINATILSLPIVTFVISSLLCIIFYRFSRRIWSDAAKNLMAFSAGTGATGYFGVPLALMIFDQQTAGIYIMAVLGVTLYDNSLGYYMSVRGNFSPKDCLKKIVMLPTLYAFLLGMLINFSQIHMPEVYTDFITSIKGVYIVVGMMIIGIGLAGLTEFKLDFKFIGMTFLAKFLAWPLCVMLVIACDRYFLGIYEPSAHQVLILISIVPLAINTVFMASLMKYQPERVAATVLLSTIFALFYLPFMTSYFINP